MFFIRPQVRSVIIKDTDERVKVGNSVLVRKSPEEEGGTYVGLVTEISNERSGLKVCVKRYLSPEETLGGKKSFHGKKELFLTREFEYISVVSIERKCFIHSWIDYARLKHVGLYDYFSRFEYEIGSGEFSPDQVDVFCKCDMPFNPDQFMLKCRNCKERYHPGCINMTDDEAKQIDSFTCDECRSLDPASSSADPVLLENLKQQLEEQARAQEERRQAAEEEKKAAEEQRQAAEQARAAEERKRAAKERQQAAEERQRAAEKRIKELQEQIKASANMTITLKVPPSPPQDYKRKQIDSFKCDEGRSLDVNQASGSASADPDMVQLSKQPRW